MLNRNVKPKGRVTSNPKPFTCDVCDWQTKFGSALKGHKKRMHSKAKLSEVFGDVTGPELDDKVNEQTRKRTKAMSKGEATSEVSDNLENNAEPKKITQLIS